MAMFSNIDGNLADMKSGEEEDVSEYMHGGWIGQIRHPC